MVDVDDAKHTTTVYLCKKFNKIVVVKEKKKKKKTFLPGSSYECRYQVSSTVNL